jgi:hypothetical protein
MFCIHCGKANPEQARFCFACGSPLISSVPSSTSVITSQETARNQPQTPQVEQPPTLVERPPADKQTPKAGDTRQRPVISLAGVDVNRRYVLTKTHTGESKAVKVGWSWTCFLFSGVFGIPLFLQGLTRWGVAMVGLWLVGVLGNQFPALLLIFFPLTFAAPVFFGLKANELAVKHYLQEGWVFTDPESDAARSLTAETTNPSTLGWVAMGAAGLLGLLLAVTLRNAGDLDLLEAASETNRSLPMMIDSETELQNVAGSNGMLTYSYRLVNVSVGNGNAQELSAAVHGSRPQLLSGVCSQTDTVALLKRGTPLRFSYADSQRHHIADIDVRPADCGL